MQPAQVVTHDVNRDGARETVLADYKAQTHNLTACCSMPYGFLAWLLPVPAHSSGGHLDLKPACVQESFQGGKTCLGLFNEGGVEQFQLGADGVVVANGVGGGAIDDVDQHAAALRVAQEFVPQPHARMRALQQP